MKSFFLALSIFLFSFVGFIVAPMFIFDVRMPEEQKVNFTDERARAIEQIEINKSNPSLSSEDLYKLYETAYPQKEIQKRYSAREIYSTAQDNYLWFTWIPVFLLILMLSKSKNELLNFVVIAIFFFIIGVINIKTLASFVLAALFGWLLKTLIKVVRTSTSS